jgi:DNA-binding FadR family transcriptional regulator
MDNGAADIDFPRTARGRGDADKLRLALERELRSDRWRDGEQLPTERELGERYGVARNTVRRALQVLEGEGFVIRHVGRGTFKAAGRASPSLAPGLEGLDGASPADVLECRLAFEPELAPLIIARASQADLDRMEECLRGAEAAESVAGFEAWDGALHDALAVATHNQAVIALARALARVRLHAEWGELKARSMTPERKAALDAEHRAVVDAIRRRDKADTRARLREHIQHVRSYMFSE